MRTISMQILNTTMLVMTLSGTTFCQADSLLVGDFENNDMSKWKKKIFAKETSYNQVSADGKKVIQAISNNSASGLFRKIYIDLTKTPYMNWSWKVDNTLVNARENTKQGDDYPARVYVVFSGGLFFWKTRALDYVWSSHQDIESIWPNAYTSNTQMIALQNDKQKIGAWVNEKRNIRDDYKNIFGVDITSADAVAIMTDTDNTGQKATAYYGNIYFTSE